MMHALQMFGNLAQNYIGTVLIDRPGEKGGSLRKKMWFYEKMVDIRPKCALELTLAKYQNRNHSFVEEICYETSFERVFEGILLQKIEYYLGCYNSQS